MTRTDTESRDGREFWVSSGHHLTQRRPDGRLAVTDALLLAYIARPELTPPPEACAAEVTLYKAMLEAPRRVVETAEVAAIDDPDARENWQVLLDFREHLLACDSVETAYLSLVLSHSQGIPHLFLQQLAHLILRNALDGCDDPHVLRAGELFFRPQKAGVHDGSMLLADLEIVEAREAINAGPLEAIFGRAPEADLDVLTDDNAWTYWSRSDAFTMAFDIGAMPGRNGMAIVIERWIAHLLGIAVKVTPVARIEDQDWRWFVGLDAEATAIGNALWRDAILAPETLGRIASLFRLDALDADAFAPDMAGAPVYLILAADRDNIIRLKPQNLISGLPLKGQEMPS
jgi:hypothetical protein